MAKILHFETSGPYCSVALGIDGELHAYFNHSGVNTHAQQITLIADKVLNQVGLQLHDLDALAVSDGPGSYTGLRVSASAAKGICFALDIPLIAISTLEALAHAAFLETKKEQNLYMPMIDARRMEVYTAVYDDQLNQLLKPTAMIINEESHKEIVTNWGENIVFCGSGVDKCASILKTKESVLLGTMISDARWLVPLADQKYNAADYRNVAYYKPFYLKSPHITKPKPLI